MWFLLVILIVVISDCYLWNGMMRRNAGTPCVEAKCPIKSLSIFDEFHCALVAARRDWKLAMSEQTILTSLATSWQMRLKPLTPSWQKHVQPTRRVAHSFRRSSMKRKHSVGEVTVRVVRVVPQRVATKDRHKGSPQRCAAIRRTTL